MRACVQRGPRPNSPLLVGAREESQGWIPESSTRTVVGLDVPQLLCLSLWDSSERAPGGDHHHMPGILVQQSIPRVTSNSRRARLPHPHPTRSYIQIIRGCSATQHDRRSSTEHADPTAPRTRHLRLRTTHRRCPHAGGDKPDPKDPLSAVSASPTLLPANPAHKFGGYLSVSTARKTTGDTTTTTVTTAAPFCAMNIEG